MAEGWVQGIRGSLCETFGAARTSAAHLCSSSVQTADAGLVLIFLARPAVKLRSSDQEGQAPEWVLASDLRFLGGRYWD